MTDPQPWDGMDSDPLDDIRQMFEIYKDDTRVKAGIDRLRKAWENPGPHPDYHRQKKSQLRDEWFLLYLAIQALLDDTKEN